MYERAITTVRSAAGSTKEFKVGVGLHKGSALSPFFCHHHRQADGGHQKGRTMGYAVSKGHGSV